MNNEPKPNDAALGKCLREWRVKPPLPPRFQEQVWRRIEQEEAAVASPWLALQALMAGLFARRAWAASYLAVALVAGLALGFFQARAETSSLSASLGQRYVQSIDPYLKMRH